MKKEVLSVLYTTIIIVGMVMVADYFKQYEIIFPEMAAIATGFFLAPKMLWKVSFIRMELFVSLCAICGVIIAIFIPGQIWVKLMLAFIVGQVILLLSKTTFSPMISAIVLPVLMQTKSIIYPISAAVLTLVVISLRLALEQSNIKDKWTYEKLVYKKDEFVLAAIRTIFVCICIFLAIRYDMRFCVAPPLLVAFVELTGLSNRAGDRPISVIFIVTGCALFGAASRYLLVIRAGAALYFAALTTTFFIVALFNLYRLHFPPAAAMGILALIVPENVLNIYPLQVFIGICVLTLTAVGFRMVQARIAISKLI